MSDQLWNYGCVQCQQYHFEGDPLYTEHIMRQDKHGLKRAVKPSADRGAVHAEPDPTLERDLRTMLGAIDSRDKGDYSVDSPAVHAEPERTQPMPFKDYGVYSPEVERELSENYTGHLGDEKHSTPAAVGAVETAQPPTPLKDWLIWDDKSECWWGPNRGGYWKSIAFAGLYTEAEAKAAEDFAQRYDRKERAVHISVHREAIERLHAALQGVAAPPALPAPQLIYKLRDQAFERAAELEPIEVDRELFAAAYVSACNDILERVAALPAPPLEKENGDDSRTAEDRNVRGLRRDEPSQLESVLEMPQAITDAELLKMWRSVYGPNAGLTGPLIRFAGLVLKARAVLPAPPDVQALIVKWRLQAAELDQVHSTMGTGWRKCADELESALAASSGMPPADKS